MPKASHRPEVYAKGSAWCAKQQWVAMKDPTTDWADPSCSLFSAAAQQGACILSMQHGTACNLHACKPWLADSQALLLRVAYTQNAFVCMLAVGTQGSPAVTVAGVAGGYSPVSKYTPSIRPGCRLCCKGSCCKWPVGILRGKGLASPSVAQTPAF